MGVRLVAYIFLFAAALFLCSMLGTAGVVILGGGTLLALLLMLVQKLDSVEKKLNDLLEQRDKE